MDRKLTWYILAGMVLGVVVGYAVHVGIPASDPWFEHLAKTFKLLSDVFLNLIKLLVAPLVLSTIVVGIAHMGDSSALGRIGVRALTWFITASFVSIALGLLMVNLFQPGVGAPIPDAVEAVATNNILQILVFSIFAGVALSAIGDKGAPLVRGAEALAEMMLQITGYVMRFAPFAVFGAIAKVVAASGLGILATYFELLVEFYVSLVLLWIILLHSRTAAARFLDRFVGSRAAQDVRTARSLRRAAPHLGLHAAAGLQLQPRRLDDVYELRDHLHRAGLWN